MYNNTYIYIYICIYIYIYVYIYIYIYTYQLYAAAVMVRAGGVDSASRVGVSKPKRLPEPAAMYLLIDIAVRHITPHIDYIQT